MPDQLLHSPADVVRWLLIQTEQGVAPSSVGAWPVFVSIEPDRPDNCITVYDTEGILEGRIQTTGEVVEQLGVMLRVRSQNYPLGYSKCLNLQRELDQQIYRRQVTVQNSTYVVHSLTRRGSILAIGKDRGNSDRFIFTLNYTLTIEVSG